MTRSGILLITAALACAAALPAQAQPVKKAVEELERGRPAGPALGIQDRAGGLHNKSNIGEFFENRGKLYARRISQGPSGEFPIGSTKEYIYRVNPMVGVPGNVIQGRYTTNEEWEAAAGFNNRDSARIAFSDKPSTWPASGWPVRDAEGNPVIVSDQDSYCVYNDSNNTRGILGIQVAQTGYAFNLKLIQDMIFFRFDITNHSAQTYDSLYFGMYVDIDVGNFSGGDPEYEDDRLGFNRDLQLVFFHDDGLSSEWPGGTTGYFGFTMIQTPLINGLPGGITDMHYNLYDDDLDLDTVQYGIMSSSPGLAAAPLGRRYFHLGSLAPNRHYDDTATIPLSGLDILANIGSGPYILAPGDTLSFVTAMVAGNTRADLFRATQRALDLHASGYSRPRPPDPPHVSVLAEDRRVTITWDDRSERSRDTLTGLYDFEGYRLYKSIDRGQHWDQIDRNQFPATGPDPVPLAEFDLVNGIGPDAGLRYVYVDTAVTNGFEYRYSVTAYDRGDSLVASLESARGNTTEAPNLGIAIPRSAAIGRVPVGASTVVQSGSGVSNVVISADATDRPEAGERTHDILILPAPTLEGGNTRAGITVGAAPGVTGSSDVYALVFLSPATYRVRNLTTGAVVVPSGVYTPGQPLSFAGLTVTLADTAASADQRPEAGDSVLIRPGMEVLANGVRVLPLRPVRYGVPQATSNGVLIQVVPADLIAGTTQVSGANPMTVAASVLDRRLMRDDVYRLEVLAVTGDSATAFLGVTLRNGADSLISRDDTLRSGDTVPGQGFSLRVQYSPDAVPAAGTVVEVRTTADRPLTYDDAFRFTTTAARSTASLTGAELDRIRVVPNPYLVSSQYEEEFGVQRREPIRALKFNNLPAQCTITIFTLDGDRVQTLDHAGPGGTATWDMRGAGGREIAPGIYIYLVKTAAAEKIGRFAVIK
jgi:hypothetical protein